MRPFGGAVKANAGSVHPNLAKQGAMAVHGPMSELKPHWRLRLDRYFLVLGPTENRGVALSAGLVSESAEPAVEAAHFLGTKASQRRVIARELQEFLHEGDVRAILRLSLAVLASAHEQSVPIFQQLARGHPSGRDDVRAIPAVAAQRRGCVRRARDRHQP